MDANEDEWLVYQSLRHRNSVYEKFGPTYCNCRDGMMFDDAVERSKTSQGYRFSARNLAYSMRSGAPYVRPLLTEQSSYQEDAIRVTTLENLCIRNRLESRR